jgi:4'-phosphopantetheinyl transferase
MTITKLYSPLTSGEGPGVRLFAMKIDLPMDDSLFEFLQQFVSEERKQRAKRFLRREDACRSIAGEALARYAIGLRERLPLHDFNFTANEYGKPFSDLSCKTQFNISHSGSWVLCAVDGLPVGVDVERIHNVDKDISKRFFSRHEHDALSALSGDAKKERFFDYWTLKESYIKAIGKGLSCPLDAFTILFEKGHIKMEMDQGLSRMFFKQYDLGPDYKCALCASHENFPEEIVFVKAEELTGFLPFSDRGKGRG